MASDPPVPPRRLLVGERVLVFFRRKRLENVLMAIFMAAVIVLFAASFLQWRRPIRMALFAGVILMAVPIGVVVNTRYWLTDQRLLRSVFGVWTEVGLDRVAAARVTKGKLGDDVRLEDASGVPVSLVPSVDNAAEVLTAHAGVKNGTLGGADGAGALAAEGAPAEQPSS